MTAFFTLLKNDIKLFLRDWKACLLLLAAPVAFMAFFSQALTPYLDKSNFIEPFSIALTDKEDTAYSRMLARQLDDLGIFKEILREDESEAMKLLETGRVGSVVIIPAGFTESVSAGENKPVTVIGSRSEPLQSYVVKTLMQSAANLVSAAQSAITSIYRYDSAAGIKGKELEDQYNDATMKFFLEALSRNEIFSQAEASPRFDLTPMEYFAAALIVVFMMFAGMPGMKMLVSERSSGLTKRLAASPVRMWQVVLSKLLVSLLLVIVQFSAIAVLTSAIFKNYWGAPIKSVLLLFGGIFLAVSAWSVFVSAISNSPASADVIGNLGILLMAVIGGSIYPLSTMPDFIRYMSRFTINRWAMGGFMVLFSGNDALGVAGYAAALAAISAVLMAFSAVFMKFARRS